MNEQVLVIARKNIEEVVAFQGFTREVDRYFTIFKNAFFMDRKKAEKDPSHKQIIPYVIFKHDDKYLSYIRGKEGGEVRLIGGRSIGIGGHINPIDFNEKWEDHGSGQKDSVFWDYIPAYKNAVDREVSEEVVIKSAYTDQIVALINDDSNEVGSVHLGVVHLRTLALPEIASNEPMISNLTFMTLPELINVRDTLETWSSICVDILEKNNEHSATQLG